MQCVTLDWSQPGKRGYEGRYGDNWQDLNMEHTDELTVHLRFLILVSALWLWKRMSLFLGTAR